VGYYRTIILHNTTEQNYCTILLHNITAQFVHYRAHNVCIKYADAMFHTPEIMSHIRTCNCMIPVAMFPVVENTTLEDLSDLKFELSEMFCRCCSICCWAGTVFWECGDATSYCCVVVQYPMCVKC
jgi:hypothetical protein